eukprot:scaffold102866_cov24-Tisochrysis_lutea.AAC.1
MGLSLMHAGWCPAKHFFGRGGHPGLKHHQCPPPGLRNYLLLIAVESEHFLNACGLLANIDLSFLLQLQRDSLLAATTGLFSSTPPLKWASLKRFKAPSWLPLLYLVRVTMQRYSEPSFNAHDFASSRRAVLLDEFRHAAPHPLPGSVLFCDPKCCCNNGDLSLSALTCSCLGMWPLPAVYAAQVSQHVWLCGHRRPRVGAHTLCACKRGQPVPSAVPGAVPDGHGTGSANCTNALSKAGCVLHTPLCLQQALSLWAAFLCKWCYLCLQASAPIANQLFVLFVIVGRCSLDWQLIYYLCSQASAPIVDSLFADSIPTGKRAGLYTGLTVSYVLSSAVGPATAAVLFVLHGDVWSTECMSRVLPLRLLAPLSK